MSRKIGICLLIVALVGFADVTTYASGSIHMGFSVENCGRSYHVEAIAGPLAQEDYSYTWRAVDPGVHIFVAGAEFMATVACSTTGLKRIEVDVSDGNGNIA